MKPDYTEILNRKYPGTEWSINGDDYEGLTWLSDGDAPSKSELDAHWNSVKQELLNEKVAKAEKRQAALLKLEALGLTEEDLKALGL